MRYLLFLLLVPVVGFAQNGEPATRYAADITTGLKNPSMSTPWNGRPVALPNVTTLEYNPPYTGVQFNPPYKADTLMIFEGIDTAEHAHVWLSDQDGPFMVQSAASRFHPWPDRELICKLCLRNFSIKERYINQFEEAKERLWKVLDESDFHSGRPGFLLSPLTPNTITVDHL